MIKIIFIDVDGTLKDELGRIPKSIDYLIEASLNKGIHLCLCTGRSIGTIQEDVNKLPIDKVISGGGSYIKLKENIIFQDNFDKNEIISLLADETLTKCAVSLENSSIMFMNKKAEDIFIGMNKKYISEMSLEEKQYYQDNEKIVYRCNMDEYNPDKYPIHKICIWCQDNQFTNINKHISSYVIVQKNIWKNEDYHEIVKVGCDKGSAVKRVLEHLNIDKEESICFGNGRNDIDMFLACGQSIAMEDSDPELKKYASSICETAKNDGIVNELKRRGII